MPIDEKALAAAVKDVRRSLQDPANVERAFMQFVISEVVKKLLTHEDLVGTGAHDLPIAAKTTQPRSTPNDDGTIEQCHSTTLVVLGAEIFSWESCITGAGTGSGHGTIIPAAATIE